MKKSWAQIILSFATNRKCGRVPLKFKKSCKDADCWSMLSQKSDQRNSIKTVCQHFQKVVSLYEESEKVKLHLSRCKAFKTDMQQQATKDYSFWLTVRGKGTRPTVLTNLWLKLIFFSLTAVVRPSFNCLVVQYCPIIDKNKFQDLLMIQYSRPNMSFSRVEHLHLREALQVLQTDVTLLSP